MGWLIKSGSYPYLEDVPEISAAMYPPYPLSIWTCGAGVYPKCAMIPENIMLGCFANAERLHTFRYSGTMAEWYNVEQGAQWRANSLFDRVLCKDGEVVLAG